MLYTNRRIQGNGLHEFLGDLHGSLAQIPRQQHGDIGGPVTIFSLFGSGKLKFTWVDANLLELV